MVFLRGLSRQSLEDGRSICLQRGFGSMLFSTRCCVVSFSLARARADRRSLVELLPLASSDHPAAVSGLLSAIGQTGRQTVRHLRPAGEGKELPLDHLL